MESAVDEKLFDAPVCASRKACFMMYLMSYMEGKKMLRSLRYSASVDGMGIGKRALKR